MVSRAKFVLEALVDFPDDALSNGRTLTAADLDAMMVKLKELGVRRVSWGYYGDGHGGWLNPAGYADGDYQGGGWKHYDATYRALGHPLKAAVEAVTTAGANLAAEVRRVRADGRFSGFVFYATQSFIKYAAKPGECTVIFAPVAAAAASLK